MYENVLVPTDGSDASEGAVERAIAHAVADDATLHTLYVVDTTVGPNGEPVGLFDALEDAGRAAIATVTERAEAAGVDTVEASIGRGPPYRAILDYAADNDVDLVVMGTHGRTGLDRYLLGSTTEKVVRLSNVPVLTVRAATVTNAE